MVGGEADLLGSVIQAKGRSSMGNPNSKGGLGQKLGVQARIILECDDAPSGRRNGLGYVEVGQAGQNCGDPRGQIRTPPVVNQAVNQEL